MKLILPELANHANIAQGVYIGLFNVLFGNVKIGPS